MTVYIDDARHKLGRMIMCHMGADTEIELHMMAAKIGVARRHYQGDHYDISLQSRKKAIEYGAVKTTQRKMAAFIRGRKARTGGHHLP